MNHTVKYVLACATLLSITPVHAAVSHFSIRSQSVNAAREMVGWQEFINRCSVDGWYGAFSITPEYTQSFRANRIAECLFGNDLCCDDDCASTIKIQGSLVPNRDARAWLADYFGLPMDYDGAISFRPRVRNFLVDLNFYLGWEHGLYFRIHAPVVYSRWDLRTSEKINVQGSLEHPDGYFASEFVPRANLLNSALDFFSGEKAPTLINESGDTPDSVIFQKLACGKWAGNCACEPTQTRLSDIEFALGWNFWCNDDYLLGIALRASAPTGNKPRGEFLFEPMVGSGGHWKVGGNFHFQGIFWRNEEETSSFGFYLDANVQHLFQVCQKRCFDLCFTGSNCCPADLENSRYMLAQRLAPITESTPPPFTLGGTSFAGYQFADEFAPVANLTTYNVDVDVKVEGDVAAKFAYTNGNFGWDLGYNFWGRSCERFCPKSNCCLPDALDGKTWALKGDSHVIGFSPTVPVRLAATQSCATIHTGVNQFTCATAFFTTVCSRANTANIDNPIFAIANATTPVDSTPANADDQTRTSVPPRALSIDNVDFAGTKGISHKLFMHTSYAWRDREDWTPFVGAGFEVEFSGRECNDDCNSCCSPCETSCQTSCSPCPATACNPCVCSPCECSPCPDTSCNRSCDDDCCDRKTGNCHRCALDQWGIWIKGGVAFN